MTRINRWAIVLVACLAPLAMACGSSVSAERSTPPAAKPTAVPRSGGGQLGGVPTTVPAIALAPAPPAAPGAPERITFGLDWLVFGRHAGFFTALDKGYYAEEGLTVEITRGFGSTDAIKRAADGSQQFVFGDTAYLFVARANEGAQVRSIGSVYNRTPHLLWYFSDQGISFPKDLEGRTLSAPAGDAIRAMFPAFARAAGIDNSTVNWQTIEPAAKYPMMLDGQAAISTEFITAMPVLQREALRAGKTLQTMRFGNNGADLYGNSLIAADSYLQEKPDVARRFLNATYRGLAYAFENQAEAAQILKKHNPEADEGLARQEVAILQDLAVTDETRVNGMGYFSPERMRRNRDLVAAAYTLNRPIEPEEAYTLEFLPKR